MKNSVKIIATAVFTVLLLSGVKLHASEPSNPPAGGKGDDSSTSTAAVALDSSKHESTPYAGSSYNRTPKIEWFLGYSYLRAVPTLSEGNRMMWLNGGSTSLAYNFNRYLGLVADFGGYDDSQIRLNGSGTTASTVVNSSGTAYTYLFGPRLSFRSQRRITPFAQVLFGGIHASDVTLSAGCAGSGCTVLPVENKFAMTAGGGLDFRIHRRFSIRILQAEYLMTRFENSNTGAGATQNDMRLSSGIVFRFGGNRGSALPPPSPLSYSCSVHPALAYIGDPVAVSGTALNLNPNKTAVYTWATDGGTVSGSMGTAQIDTRTTSAGIYTLKGHVSEGEMPGENADCSARFEVKALEPPTVSCSASPSAVVAGNPSTISVTAISPQNRPLSYSYKADYGAISGDGSTATLSTLGAPLGTATVICNVLDDKGQTASAATSVTITPPVVAAKPITSSLCSVHFDRDARRPSRVDNEGKACLDEIALTLQRSSDTQLALVGNSATTEKLGKKLAADRAANTKAYLTKDKGIDAARVLLYTGSAGNKSVETILIPTGATLDSTGDVLVDESTTIRSSTPNQRRP